MMAMMAPPKVLFLASLLSLAAATDSYTVGNITANTPYDISPEAMSAALRASKGIAGSITGYDVSLPPSNITPSSNSSASSFWFGNKLLQPDVPLSSSSDSAVSKDKFTEITAIGLQGNPNQTWDEKGWRVCATVFTGGVPGWTGKGFNPSPSCRGILSDECIEELKLYSKENATNSLNGNCNEKIGFPPKCGALIGENQAQISTQINSSTLSGSFDGQSFFAYGTPPTTKGDNVTIAAAAEQIWPVVINWAHLDENGDVQSSNPVVACMSNTGYRYSGASLSKEVSRLAVCIALGLTVWGTGVIS